MDRLFMQRRRFSVLIAAAVLFLLSACAPGQAAIAPPEIRYGEDICEECNMIISDPRFAAGYAHQVAEGRYESVAFDDIGDMLNHAANHPDREIVAWYVHDYASEEWIDATQAFYVVSTAIQSPMASGLAAFASDAQAEEAASEWDGERLSWEELRARFDAGSLLSGGGMHEHAAVSDMHMADDELLLGAAELDGYRLELVTHTPLQAGHNEVASGTRSAILVFSSTT